MLLYAGDLSDGGERMATYLVLNILFTLAVLAVLIALRTFKFNKAVALALVMLIVSTVIFDSMIIGVDIVDYDYQLLTGLKIVGAPIEDFFYAFVAGLLVPSVWNLIRKEESK